MTHSTTSAGPRRTAWGWALCGLWFVACLNPMPDDFPNERESVTIGVDGPAEAPPTTENDNDQGSSPQPAPGAGGLTDEGSAGGSPSGEAGAGGSGGGGRADAGAAEADAGP